MPKGTIEDYADDSVTSFVLRWNDWSTADDRQQVYARAWKLDHSSALGFITAMASDRNDKVPDHIVHYLEKHPEFSPVFLKAFKRVKKYNWRFGAVVNQFDFSFAPAVTLTESRKAGIVMLYVVGDPTV